ncbi:hypothetical protein LTY36_04775 [Limosilactobacillus agrestis]|uniref:Uncharacterized protein n=1 Tax=Limosilactobacillus agrestis TaxID=2759748 RepID=A0A7W3UG34_9LACO|nr:hypothetical protein [Limosilactobacillus agrestis]MBD5090216.1 hypothetical protein [Lactobacillus sp.]MBB1094791.1 hypothetical protein [Limosilactobacillus agrestis]MBB1099862.1 hypothetical protein [Limosilactobacillus agrestis]MCD7113108.1 hypothetical protein [Limosilactobacillus agrestis]MCD7120766.1 hypothetical protein [Limosilactobacillus agrestis]
MQRLKKLQEEFKRLSTEISQLKSGIDELQASIPGVQKFVNDVERDIKKWKFKTEPRLNRIQIILDVLKIDQKEQHK